jgi:hypothetical protein
MVDVAAATASSFRGDGVPGLGASFQAPPLKTPGQDRAPGNLPRLEYSARVCGVRRPMGPLQRHLVPGLELTLENPTNGTHQGGELTVGPHYLERRPLGSAGPSFRGPRVVIYKGGTVCQTPPKAWTPAPLMLMG